MHLDNQKLDVRTVKQTEIVIERFVSYPIKYSIKPAFKTNNTTFRSFPSPARVQNANWYQKSELQQNPLDKRKSFSFSKRKQGEEKQRAYEKKKEREGGSKDKRVAGDKSFLNESSKRKS